MIIVHFAEYVSGGVHSYLETLINAQCLDPKVEKVYLFCSEYKSQTIQCDSTKFVCIKYSYLRGIKGIFQLLNQWHKVLEVKPTVIHLHSTWAGFLRFRIFGSIHRHPPVIYCAHGWAFLAARAHWKSRIIAIIERVLLLNTNAIINISKSEQAGAIQYGLNAHKMYVIRNTESRDILPSEVSIAEDFWKSRPQGELRLLYVGRYDWLKGTDLLLDAFMKLKRPASLVMAGGRVVDGIQIPKRSNLLDVGWQQSNAIRWLMQSSDIVVIPSRAEGFGLVALEALFSGSIVVANRVGGIPELVQDGVTGRLINATDPDELALALNTIDKSNFDMYRKNIRKFVASYPTIGDMEKSVMRIYKSVE